MKKDKNNEDSYDIQEYLDDYVKDYPDKEIRIINAAINTFAEKGFKSTKTKEIADRAGIAVGTIFRYFPNKDSILERMVPLLIRILRPGIENPIIDIINDTRGSSLAVVYRTIILDRLRMIRDNQRFIKSVLPELIHRAPLLQQLKESILPLIEKYMTQVIDDAKRRGEVREDLNVGTVLYQIMGFIIIYSMLGGLDDEAKIENDVDTFIQYAMKGWQA